jgi:KaiC/GvpD/RAD55 family RecA-like ATPase
MKQDIKSHDGLLRTISDFFNSGGTSLLVKGRPGTGKTTFAFTLASVLKPRRVTYITSRSSEDAISRQFPWLVEELPETVVADLRLGVAEQLVEQFMNALKHDDNLIILDSWDSFARIVAPSDALKTESALIQLASSPTKGVKVVFVSERTEVSPLEYAVDGVVSMHATLIGGRTIRTLRLIKLRGVRIDKPMYIYTLESAKVSTAQSLNLESVSMHFDDVQVPEDHWSLGLVELEAKLGAPRMGEVVACEYSPRVDNKFRLYVHAATLINLTKRGWGAVIVSHMENYVEALLQNSRGTLGDEVYKRIWFLVPSKRLPHPNVVSLPNHPDDLQGVLEKTIESARSASPTQKCLVMLSELAIHKYGASQVPKSVVPLIMSDAKAAAEAFVYCGDMKSGFMKTAYALVDKHIRFTVVGDSLLIYGVKPHTPFYMVKPSSHDGIGLARIV